MAQGTRPESERFPFREPMVLRLSSGQEVSATLFNLSMTGMYVATEETFPAGTDLTFVGHIEEAGSPIQGEAKVAWRRREGGSDSRPPGMGMIFRRLDPNSRRIIRDLIQARQGSSQPVQDLDNKPEDTARMHPLLELDPSKSPPPRSDLLQAAQATFVPQPQRRRLSAPLLAFLGVLLVASVAFFFIRWMTRTNESGQLQIAQGISALDPASRQAAGGEPIEGPPPTGGTSPATEAEGSATPISTAGSLTAEDGESGSGRTPTTAIRSVVETWLDAWSAQDVIAYLACYGSTFDPPGELSRRQWEQTRRERLTAPGFIELTMSDFQVTQTNETLNASFRQRYRSNLHQDVVRKTLEMTREPEGWKIVSESSSPLG